MTRDNTDTVLDFQRNQGKMIPMFLAYDIGGTKIETGILNASGKVVKSHRIPLNLKNGSKELISLLRDQGLHYLRQYPRIRHIGIASAGPLDPAKGLLLNPTNIPEIHNVYVTKELKKSFQRVGAQISSIVMDNDAACAMLAERWVGSARRTANALMLTLGTGLGTGILCNGTLVRSGRGLHTEAGHLILNPSDRTAPCGCGNFGCAEAYLSGRAFEKRYRSIAKSNLEMIEKAKRGDGKALSAFDDYAYWLAVMIHNCSVVFSPEMVILGGSFAKTSRYFLPQTRKHLEVFLQNRKKPINLIPKIVVSKLQNRSCLIGAGYLVKLRHGNRVD